MIIPEHIKPLVRELTEHTDPDTVPKMWDHFIVIVPTLKRYYSSISKDPALYEEIIRKRLVPRYDTIAVVLQRMLNYDRNYKFLVFSKSARPTVEVWLRNNGLTRSATRMGQGKDPTRVLYRVYSKKTKLMRYVSGDNDACHSEIIKLANASIKLWLSSRTSVSESVRRTIRSATDSTLRNGENIFEEDAIVIKTDLYTGVEVADYRSITINQNITALKAFVLNTTTL